MSARDKINVHANSWIFWFCQGPNCLNINIYMCNSKKTQRKRRFGSNQAKPVTTFWSIRPKMKIKWKQLFFPHRSLRDPRRCEFKFLCNCFIHSSLMPNNTFCLYFQVTLQTENKRIGQHGKHTNCLSNESTFPFIFESHTNSQQKNPQEPKYTKKKTLHHSVSEPYLYEW